MLIKKQLLKSTHFGTHTSKHVRMTERDIIHHKRIQKLEIDLNACAQEGSVAFSECGIRQIGLDVVELEFGIWIQVPVRACGKVRHPSA